MKLVTKEQRQQATLDWLDNLSLDDFVEGHQVLPKTLFNDSPVLKYTKPNIYLKAISNIIGKVDKGLKLGAEYLLFTSQEKKSHNFIHSGEKHTKDYCQYNNLLQQDNKQKIYDKVYFGSN